MNQEQLEIEPSFMAELWPDKREYWACRGTALPTEEAKEILGAVPFIRVYYSKEDAEADASIPCKIWAWNGKPASTITLSEAMFKARTAGLAGVKIISYSNGEWITVREYPANVPLPEELRDEA